MSEERHTDVPVGDMRTPPATNPPQRRKGRPVAWTKGKPVPFAQPSLPLHRQSIEVEGVPLRLAGRESLYYQEKERLYAPFWKSMSLKVIQPMIRSSGRGTLRECPRKFMFQERLGLKTKGYVSALGLGDIWHRMAAPIYKGADVSVLPRFMAEAVAEYQEAASKLADKDLGVMPSGRPLSDQLIEIEQDGKKALAMIQTFFEVYPIEKLFENYEVIGTEVPIAIKVPSMAVPIGIQIDVILKNRKSGEVWLVDHKTTSLSPMVRAAVLPFEFQPRLYKWVWKTAADDDARQNAQMFGTEVELPKLGGFMHNIIRKPTIRYCAKDKDFDAYAARVREWYKEQSEKDANDPPILQSVVRHVGALMDEEFLVQLHQMARFSSCRLSLAQFYRNDRSCMGKFGNSACPYLPLCSNEHRIDEWPKIIAKTYVQDFRTLAEEETQ